VNYDYHGIHTIKYDSCPFGKRPSYRAIDNSSLLSSF